MVTLPHVQSTACDTYTHNMPVRRHTKNNPCNTCSHRLGNAITLGRAGNHPWSMHKVARWASNTLNGQVWKPPGPCRSCQTLHDNFFTNELLVSQVSTAMPPRIDQILRFASQQPHCLLRNGTQQTDPRCSDGTSSGRPPKVLLTSSTSPFPSEKQNLPKTPMCETTEAPENTHILKTQNDKCFFGK